MKRNCSFQLILLFTIIASTIVFPQSKLTILHVNDTHSMLAPMGPRNPDLQGTTGGIARAATIIKETRETDQNLLLLHGGDSFVGDMFFNNYLGLSEFRLMKYLGFDAMAVGNHEFDLTPDVLLQACSRALKNESFPLLSSNLILEDPAVQALKTYIKPYTIKKIGEIKAGIFSLTTPETNYLSQPSPAAIGENIGEIAANTVQTLLTEGCQIIICISHLGTKYDKELASGIPGINVIISSHDHLKTNSPVEITNPSGLTTFIVEAGSHYSAIGKMELIVMENKVKLAGYKLIPLDASVAEDTFVSIAVKELTSGIEAKYGPVYSVQAGTATDYLEELAVNLTSDGPHDTPVGDLIADALRQKTGTEIAIVVGGSIALPIQKGPIVPADAFRAVGYGFNEDNGLGFRIVTYKMTGLDLMTALEFTLQAIEADDELLPQVSGMKYVYNALRPVGQRLVNVQINGTPLDPEKQYSITTNEFMYTALITLVGIQPAEVNLYSGISEFQVLNDYITEIKTITPATDGRVSCDNSALDKLRDKFQSEAISNKTVIPDQFNLEQNYPNPFNPSTKIRYTIPAFSRVKLQIFDLLGNEIALLADEAKPQGSYEVEVNAADYNMTSGIYFYRIQAGKFLDTKKFILLK